MKKPSTIILILAIIALVILLPKAWLIGLFGLAWWVIKVAIIGIAILVIFFYFTKKK